MRPDAERAENFKPLFSTWMHRIDRIKTKTKILFILSIHVSFVFAVLRVPRASA